MKRLVTLFVLISVSALFAEKQPLSRYQSIIDRRPFGQPPPGYDPDATAAEAAAAGSAAALQEPLTQDQEQLQKAVNFSVMNINTDGSVSVGFTDRTDPKAPALYYLREGETRDGWTVKSVDVHARDLVLDKDGVEITLHLGDNAKPVAAKGGAVRSAPSRPGLAGRSGLLGPRPAQAGADNAPVSFASRREKRRQEAAAAEKARADQEAERKRLAEEAEAKAEADKAQREEERAATRQQLQAIQEELRKAREEKLQRQREQEGKDDGDGNNEP